MKVETQHLSTRQHSSKYTCDFLLPTAIVYKPCVSTIPHSKKPALSSGPARSQLPLQRRTFSVSPVAQAAVVTANPRKDEDGNDMLIDITARAAKVFSSHSSRPHPPTAADTGSSVLKRSCRRIPTLILLYESQSSLAGAMAFNTSCLLPILLQYPLKMIQYSSQVTVRGQRW